MIAALAIFAIVLCTSIVSGIFGMAGGLILMLILALWLPVPAAMVLHGVTQFFSNGWRAWLWRRWIDWRIVGLYILGALPATLLSLVVAYVPDKPTMLIALGLVPYAALALPASLALDATRRSHAIACGFLVAGTQLIAGVAGPLLDVFFVRSTSLDRRAVVATKATTQALSHTLKVGYYGALVAGLPALGAEIYAAAIAAAVVGTTLAGPILEKLSNAQFRRWTRVIVLVVGTISIVQGIALLAG
ncbi:MAG: sulfite exporter TauE/SafE family protein [Alphaproteobacteria bacterium]|nr:sulfite exporter TauE/SafE family protein [Alphaproteobacteria bacterium]